MGVDVLGGSRFHLSLVDMNGSFTARVDGGVGLILNEPRIWIHLERLDEIKAQGGMSSDVAAGELEEAARSLLRVMRAKGLIGSTRATIREAPLAHSGLGAKTQVLMAVARGALSLWKVEVEFDEIVKLTGRGGTSGIGVYGHQRGGLIVDGGHPIRRKNDGDIFRPSSRSAAAGPPPLLVRMTMPDWPILLLIPLGKAIYGETEAILFKQVCPVPLEDVRRLCHIVLMKLLPAVAEHNLEAFGEALWDIQECRWKAFEISSQAAEVNRLMRRLRDDLLIVGAAMSSWGTAIMCVDPRLTGQSSEGFAQSVKELMFEEAGGGLALLTAPRNDGATVAFVSR